MPELAGNSPRPLSIIVPALDEGAAIACTLQALAPARCRGTEVIVVDGGSRDDTMAICQGLADRVLLAPKGRALQLNAGAAVASGDVLLFLHADCVAPPQVDRTVLDAVAGRSLAWGRFDVRIASARRSLAVVAAMMNLRSRATGIATGDQGIFATRPLFDRVGGFPPQPLMEDIAFCRTAKRLCEPLCLSTKLTTSGRRWERNGILRTIVLMWRLRLSYFLGADPRELCARYDRGR